MNDAGPADEAGPLCQDSAFVAYAVPTVALKKAGVKVEEVFAGSQEGALAQLKAGRVEAAAVNSRFLAQYSEREGVRFRELLHLRALSRAGGRGASAGTGRHRRAFVPSRSR